MKTQFNVIPKVTGEVFDWDKAARIINFWKRLHPNLIAYAGLKEDWNHSFDIIFKNGQPTKATYARLGSNIDKPILVVFLRDDNYYFHEYTCHEQASGSRFHALSRWDKISLEILNGQNQMQSDDELNKGI